MKTKRVNIRVTMEDILNGRLGDRFSCPIALACRRAGFEWGIGNPLIHDRNGNVIGSLSERATKFVHDFDRCKRVDPSTFVFTVRR